MDAIPHIALVRGDAVSLTKQLISQLRNAILAGELLPGDSLPATRQLAEALGVSRTVVVGAYEQLLGEAFLDTTPGSGTRVCSAIPGLSHISEPQHSVSDEPRSATVHPSAEPINLCTGRPFVATAPPREWARALSRAARMPWLSDALSSRGDEALRQELAHHLRLFRGIRCTADDVVVTSGTSEALLLVGLALQQMNGGNSRVAVEDPGYSEGKAALEHAGVTCFPVEVGADGIRVEHLVQLHKTLQFNAVMLTPSHQFPLGGRLPAEDRLAILNWAHLSDALVIEDDYDSEFRHTGAVLPSVASINPHGNTVYIASLNKILSPSLRCGMIVLPAGNLEMRERLLRAREVIGSSVSAHTQYALTQFVQSGGLKRAIARNTREYRHRRKLLLDFFAQHGIEVSGEDGGLHVVINLPPSICAEAVAEELKQRGVLVETLSEFSVDESTWNGLALGYGAESIPRLMQGLELVATAVLNPVVVPKVDR